MAAKTKRSVLTAIPLTLIALTAGCSIEAEADRSLDLIVRESSGWTVADSYSWDAPYEVVNSVAQQTGKHIISTERPINRDTSAKNGDWLGRQRVVVVEDFEAAPKDNEVNHVM